MTQSQENFNKSLVYIKRKGIENLVNWLTSETDFFTAPSSAIYHGNFEEGLLQHSLNVLSFALNNFNYIVKRKPEYEYLRESVVIAALFHDVCKTNYYVKQNKWTKDENNKWKEYLGWTVADTFPMGHGEKSIYLISKYIELTESEVLAIRWHMGMYDISPTASNFTLNAYNQASSHPLVRIINSADSLTLIVEETVDYKNLH